MQINLTNLVIYNFLAHKNIHREIFRLFPQRQKSYNSVNIFRKATITVFKIK